MAEESKPQDEQNAPAPEAAGSEADDLRQAEDAIAAVEGAAAAVEDAVATDAPDGSPDGSAGGSAGGPGSVDMPAFGTNGAAEGTVNGTDSAGINLLGDVALRVKIELGRTRMYVEDVLRLNTDSVIELDKAAGDPVDIFVNDRHIARGEVLVLNENFCVRVSEIIDNGAGED